MPKLVLLDTNFLMIPAQFKIDIFSEIDRICSFGFTIAVLDRTVEELESIKKLQKGRNRLAADFALKLLKKKDLKIIRTNSKKAVDDLIAEFAEKGAIVATQDSALRKIIKNNKGMTIVLRNKRFLKME
jgi:rRNA-processing protein FCF1